MPCDAKSCFPVLEGECWQLSPGRRQELPSGRSVPIAVLGDGGILGDREEPFFPFPSLVPLCPLQYLSLSFPTILAARLWDQGPRWVSPYYTNCLNAGATPALAQKGQKSKGGSREKVGKMTRDWVV